MKIIEIQALDNGAHRNQTLNGTMPTPKGWAVIPDDMETPNFPFGDIETADEDIIDYEIVIDEETKKRKKVEKVVGTRKVVTKWTAGVIPEEEESEPTVSEMEQLRADVDYIAVMTGVEL